MLRKKLYTLVFLFEENNVLLGLKKRGFGYNKWNGFGGKIEQNESIVEAAVRELKEECCVAVKHENLKNVGRLEFTFEGEPIVMDVRVFSAKVFQGTPRETEEMTPKWYKYDDIPFDNMWPDDKIWFPYMLSGNLFYGKFNYRGFDTIISYDIKKFDSVHELNKYNEDLNTN
ncbi:7,8-dihydro-8-oxoguanine triphosphatase [Eumeta japonica]|uniref:Oxidized purine nucleoside triphosphate hydrolase n=1 Tax=Eumeta variegata TaxID=151549 RepID=A0A4C1X0Y7_EUMVA|nr:7,8-dihydro-8-oxoguanine triphosphatase [Eumeta japonica]